MNNRSYLVLAVVGFTLTLVLLVAAALPAAAQTMSIPCPLQPAPWQVGYHPHVYTSALAAHHEASPPEFVAGVFDYNTPLDRHESRLPFSCIAWPLGGALGGGYNYGLANELVTQVERLRTDPGGPARAIIWYDVISRSSSAADNLTAEYWTTQYRDWGPYIHRDNRFVSAIKETSGRLRLIKDEELLQAIGRQWGQRGRVLTGTGSLSPSPTPTKQPTTSVTPTVVVIAPSLEARLRALESEAERQRQRAAEQDERMDRLLDALERLAPTPVAAP